MWPLTTLAHERLIFVATPTTPTGRQTQESWLLLRHPLDVLLGCVDAGECSCNLRQPLRGRRQCG